MKPAHPVCTVACITCYFDPDYVRSRTLRTALSDNPDVRLIVIKNTTRGAGRYPEVLWKLLKTRFRDKPDIYLLNFRGYELLPFLLLIAGRKPIIYDEFVNPVLVVGEHRKLKKGVVRALMSLWGIVAGVYYLMLKRCSAILTDTAANAEYTSRLSGIDRRRYHDLAVGTDERLFHTVPTHAAGSGTFQVFFYSPGVQPLHGVPVVLEAARLLKDRADIVFRLAGNKGGIAGRVAAARADGAHIEHTAWIPFDDLPQVIHASGICLGGPFGDTLQAQLVVTGKTYQFLACGAATIVGASGATERFFVDKQNSLVVPRNDAAALADAIRWAADHPAGVARIGRAGRKLYERQFSRTVIHDDLAAILRPYQ